MSPADLEDLQRLYAGSVDPWNFRESAYEQAKFAATRDALARPRYAACLELGCGNGELARHVAPLCDRYVGVDAVEIAVAEARRAVPAATFLTGVLPEDLPAGSFDLLILSEVLYFFESDAIRDLARRIHRRWPRAEIVCVCYLGPTEQALTGAQAFEAFAGALPERRFETIARTKDYCIARSLAEAGDDA
ncbi:MAG: class I SAM-dependent methyltransferase [Sedimentitalea sp.]|nr:class I SAM-dependent methyltransferase [Sedimentitalea sp.]